MWACDGDFLQRVKARDECVISTIPENRYFDLEVYVDPTVGPNSDETTVLDRFDALRMPFRDRGPCSAVISIGDLTSARRYKLWAASFRSLRERETNTDVFLVPGTARRAANYYAKVARSFLCNADGDDRVPQVVTSIYRVPGEDATAAHVALIGLYPTNDSEDQARQLDLVEKLVRAMGRDIASHSPLYVIAVTRQALLRHTTAVGQIPYASDLLRRLQECRVSIVLHHGPRRPDVTTVATAPDDPLGYLNELCVVGCPTFERGTGYPGMGRVRLDLLRGEAEVALSYEVGSDRATKPLQIVRPMLSASRVTAAERRLYSRVRELTAPVATTDNTPAADAFRQHVEDTWTSDAYVPLCQREGGPLGFPSTRTLQHLLLLLLRERDDGGYEVLLSRHTPISPTAVAEWEALLVPAFTNVRSLLERLRDDVVRLAGERPEDLQSAERARNFEDAVEAILRDHEGGDVWADQLRDVASLKVVRKVSPTTGCVTTHEYRLVTLLPLVDRRARDDQAAEDSDPSRREHWRRVGKIADWLMKLDAVRDAETGDGFPMEALQAGGSALRWDPKTALDAATPAARRKSRRAPRGAIWFPLGDAADPPWRSCPAIVARNADVMAWVDDVLTKTRDAEGRLPNYLLLGKAPITADEYAIDQWHPFATSAAPGQPPVEQTGACSTLEALAKVQFTREHDLREQLAYPDAIVTRVFLARKTVQARGESRDVILLYDADLFADEAAVAAAAPTEALGALRPVQRYVLTSGIERVIALRREVLEPWWTDIGHRWGFVEIRKGAVPATVALTPPILEEIPTSEWENPEGQGEYVICDGNHRVVHLVWREGEIVPALALRQPLPEPYYAVPFSGLEWKITSSQERPLTPDLASKYQTRSVPEDVIERAGPEVAKEELHRRYFRDLSTGFGPLGGQGGKFVG